MFYRRVFTCSKFLGGGYIHWSNIEEELYPKAIGCLFTGSCKVRTESDSAKFAKPGSFLSQSDKAEIEKLMAEQAREDSERSLEGT